MLKLLGPWRPTRFAPPSVFSAPLPSGSGARALGLAGAFTALADDATAASWNPAGLTWLERPEASIVYRISYEENEHHSRDSDVEVGRDRYDNNNLNYFSIALPFYFAPLARGGVLSLNLQEAYDFTQALSANLSDTSITRVNDKQREELGSTHVEVVDQSTAVGTASVRTLVTFTSDIRTESQTVFQQLITSHTLTGLEFDQQGIIDAWTPALALQVTPTLSLGVSFNYYRESEMPGTSIRSRLFASFEGQSESQVDAVSHNVSQGTTTYSGEQIINIPGFFPFTNDISGSFPLDPFDSTDRARNQDRIETEGTFEEINRFEGLEGFNFTLGLLWQAGNRFRVGASVDLPWTAEGTQRRTTHTRITTFDEVRSRILDVTELRRDEEKGHGV